MSSTLISCVRKNSPPLELTSTQSLSSFTQQCGKNDGNLIGSRKPRKHYTSPVYVCNKSANRTNLLRSDDIIANNHNIMDDIMEGMGDPSSNITTGGEEQQKRRRFRPLHNLKRIFRRRTITASTTTAKDLDSTDSACYNDNESNRSKNINIGSDSCLSTVISNISVSAPNSSSLMPHQHYHHHPVEEMQTQTQTHTHLAKTLPKTRNSYQLLFASTSDHSNQEHLLQKPSESHISTDDNSLMGLMKRSEDELPIKHLVTKKKNTEHFTVNSSANEFQLPTAAAATESLTDCHCVEEYSDTNMSATNIRYNQQNQLNDDNYPGEDVMGGIGVAQPTAAAAAAAAMNNHRILGMQCSALHNSIDSLHDLDGNGSNDSGTGCMNTHNNSRLTVGSTSSEKPTQRYVDIMNCNRRSLSEGLLIDSACSHELFSQSHDSVFSDSVTASSLSITLKAELANALRKRNAHRADASDEDLGLPRSPSSADRQAAHYTANISSGSDSGINKSGRSAESKICTSIQTERSLSLLSINSADMENALMNASTDISSNMIQTTEKPQVEELKELPSTSSTSLDALQNFAFNSKAEENFDEADFCCSKVASLSHVAAKHKLSVKPTKKKTPSRQHRRALEISLMDGGTVDLDKIGDHSVGFNRKEDKMKDKEHRHQGVISLSKQMPVDTSSTLTITLNNCNESNTSLNTDVTGSKSVFPKTKSEYSYKDGEKNLDLLQRLIQKHSSAKYQKPSKRLHLISDELCANQKSAKIPILIEAKMNSLSEQQQHQQQIHNSCVTPNEVEQNSNANEGKYQPKWSSTPLLNTSEHLPSKDKVNNRKFDSQTTQKSKTGPAARQRYLPQNISSESLNNLKMPTIHIDKGSQHPATANEGTRQKSVNDDGKPNRISECPGEVFQSTSIIKEITSSHPYISAYPTKKEQPRHFERKVKVSTLSAFQQKISRSNDAFLTNSNNITTTTKYCFDKCDPIDTVVVKIDKCQEQQKQGKCVEKSKSFRSYGYLKTRSSSLLLNNVPSLPDLTLNDHGDESNQCSLYNRYCYNTQHSEDKDSSLLDIRINDNTNTNLMETATESERNILLDNNTRSYNCPISGPFKLITKSNLTTDNDEQNKRKNSTVSNVFKNVLDKNTASYSIQQHSFEKVDDVISNISTPKLHSLHSNVTANSYLCGDISQNEDKVLRSNRRGNATKSMIITKSEEFNERAERKFSRVIERNSIANFETGLDANGNVPEFMKVQLNRVDPERLSKSHVVLAKNYPLTTNEHTIKPNDTKLMDQSIGKQNSSPIIINNVITPHRMDTSNEDTQSTGENERPNPKSILETSTSLSLQDRKRLLMVHEKDRNAVAKSRMQMDECKVQNGIKEHNILTAKENGDGNEATASVVLRKHSFVYGNNIRGNQEDAIHNSHNSHNVNIASNTNINHNPIAEDAIPELIKVFARRSLKLKNDEELDKFINKNNPIATNSTAVVNAASIQKLKESKCNNTSIDPDTLNHLYKLHDIEANISGVTKIITDPCIAANLKNIASTASNRSLQSNATNCNNYSSLSAHKLLNSLPLFSKNNTKTLNENNSSETAPAGAAASSITYSNLRKSVFSPIKLNDVHCNSTIEELPLCNNNNNNNSISSLGKTSITQQSNIPNTTVIKTTLPTSSISVVTGTSINITISNKHNNNLLNEEFKCIHQRRAEWEQRAKQALK